MPDIADGYHWLKNSAGDWHIVLVSTDDDGTRWVRDCFLCADKLQDFLADHPEIELIPAAKPSP